MLTTELPTTYHRFLDVVRSGNTDDLLAMFGPHGSVNDWGHQYKGVDAIRTWSEREFLGVGVTLDVSRVIDVEGRITIKALVGGQGFNGPSTLVLVTRDDLLSELLITS